jgi:uncharacterized protein YndB with AHSA1/START domain
MPRIERSIEINAPVEKVYKIIEERPKFPIWNLVINNMTHIDGQKWKVDSTVGEIISTRTEAIENEKFTDSQKGGPLTKMGYLFKPTSTGTRTTLWGEFNDEKNEKMLLKAGEIFLDCLKKYAEYLEAGGNPEDYKKK